MITFDKFKYYCDTILCFLEIEYGFVKTRIEENSHGYYITYKNSTTAIRFSYELKECMVFVLLSRLIDGEVPRYPIFIKPESILNSFYIDDILKLKAPSSENEFENRSLKSEIEIEEVINSYAQCLKQYAIETLQGNFKIFEKLDLIVKSRSNT